MAQVIDFNIAANPSGLNMRTELNGIIEAILTQNSGTDEPLNPFSGMEWVDKSDVNFYYIKKRNLTNDDWEVIYVYDVLNNKITPFGEIAYTIETVNDFVNIPTIYKTAIVKDIDRGGIFIWSATGTANGGTVFAGVSGYWNRQYSGAVNVKWFGANETRTDNEVPIQAAIYYANSINKNIIIDGGVYLISNTINMGNVYITISGANTKTTIIKASVAIDIIFDFSQTEGQVSAATLCNLSIDGNSLTTYGIFIENRHMLSLEKLVISNCSTGYYAINNWLCSASDVRIVDCGKCWWLAGSNHNCIYTRVSAIGFSDIGIKIDNGIDGNIALLFNACDIEFGNGTGIDNNGTVVDFNSCYIGENVFGNIIINRGGTININGGILFVGYNTLVKSLMLLGGIINISKTKISGQSSIGFDHILYSSGGKVKFESITTGLTLGGEMVCDGDVFGYGSQYPSFAQSNGKDYFGYSYNGSVTNTITDNSLTTTCVTPGSPNLMSVQADLVNKGKWKNNEYACLIVVYKSNVNMIARLEAGSWGAAPLIDFGTLPSSSGSVKTFIKLLTPFSSSDYNKLDFWEYVSAGSYFTLYSVSLADSRFIQHTTVGNIANLYKC